MFLIIIIIFINFCVIYIYLYRNDDDENNNSNNNGTVITYRNKLLEIETFAEPLERTYDENDLLTKIYHINPNWKPGDPEDYRYITSYINEGYTGFLPVKLKINPPNFVHQWGIENFDGSITWKSLPILENGKFKYYYNSGQEGPFALGFIPVKRYNQNTEDYDFIVNIPGEVIKSNIATLKITDGVLDSILTMEGGTLNLPSSLPALNQATAFNANGKDYATSVSIDLSELTYYPNMPMPQFNNGNGSNTIEITENNSRTTFEELDGNRKNIEYITTPENPAPAPLMRSIVVKNNKGKTRDATTSNIVGYIDVNIPPPNITQTIRNNGYYNFNSDWTALVEGTEQNHKLDIQVTTNTTTKTITIDSIGNNQSTTYNASTDNVDGFSSVTIINNTSSSVPLEEKTVEYIPGGNLPTVTVSNGYYGIRSINFTPITSGFECVNLFQGVTIEDINDRVITEFGKDYSVKTVSFNNKYYAFDNTTITSQQLYNLITGNVTEDIRTYGNNYVYIWADTPFILNSIFCYIDGTMILYGSNDAIVWNKLTNEFYQNASPQHFPNLTISWKFYKLYYRGRGSNVSHTSTVIPYFCIDSSYNYNNLNLEHNKELTITNSDLGSTIYLNPSTGYDGFSNAIITVPNIHANPNLYTLPTIQSNNTYSLPSGYDGFAGPITVNVQPTINYVTKWRLVLTYKNGNDVTTTEEEYYTKHMYTYPSDHNETLSEGTSSKKYFVLWANETSFGFYIWNSNGSVGGGGSTSVNIPKGHYYKDEFTNRTNYPFETVGYSCVFQSVTLYLLDSNNNTLWTYTDTVPSNTFVPHLFSGTTTIERDNVMISFV